MGFVISSNLFSLWRFLLVPTDFSRANFLDWVRQQTRKGTATIGMVVLDGIKKRRTLSVLVVMFSTWIKPTVPFCLQRVIAQCGSNHNLIFTKVDNFRSSLLFKYWTVILNRYFSKWNFILVYDIKNISWLSARWLVSKELWMGRIPKGGEPILLNVIFTGV